MKKQLRLFEYNAPLSLDSDYIMVFVWIGVIVIVYILLKLLNSTDVPKIHGLPEAPGWPIFGSLFQLGENHYVALAQMAKKLGPVFQIRMGNKRIIVANSFDSIR